MNPDPNLNPPKIESVHRRLRTPDAAWAEGAMQGNFPPPDPDKFMRAHPREDAFEAPAKPDRRLPVKDMVNLPQHYARYKIEPIHFIVENGLDFMRGNAVKYILRCDAKNGREDLAKARRYLDMFERFYFDKNPDWWRIAP